MKEYIERSAAMQFILGLTIVDPAVAQYANAVYYNLQSLPAADVAPVRHGRWHLAEDAVFRCSECGRICYELDAPYCYCGARMDKEDEHEVS